MPITIDVLENDGDVEGSSLTPRVSLEPLHGTVVVNADGTLTYAPHPAFFGDDSFAYVVSDGELESEPAVVSISVAATEPGVTLFNRVLQVIGSEAEDKIKLQSKNSEIEVSIRLGNQNKQTWSFPESDIDRIVILGAGGDDKIHMDREIPIPAFIDGGSGNDRIRSGAGNDEIVGGDGDDRIETNDGDDLVTDLLGNNRIWTGNGNDVVVAGAGDDRIATGDGNDVIQSGTGTNLIFAGDGNDWIEAGDGDDTISAGVGDDIVLAGAGNNQVRLQAGDDIAIAGSGNDTLLGGSGLDLLVGGGGEDLLLGGQDDDLLISGLWIESDAAGTLQAIHQVWKNTELTYQERIDAIMNGVDSDDGLVVIGDSIDNDADADMLIGGGGQDWGWADPDNDEWMLALSEILSELT
jgi:Ca2+-binding RTX toxin-like protein